MEASEKLKFAARLRERVAAVRYRNIKQSLLKRKDQLRSSVIYIVLPLIAFLFILAALAMNTVSARSVALKQTWDNLLMSAADQSATLNLALNTQMEALALIASGIAEIDPDDIETIINRVRSAAEVSFFLRVCYAKPDGVSYANNGETQNISGRAYFQTAMTGQRTIERVEDPIGGDSPLIVLAVPLIVNQKTAGVIHGSYEISALERLLIPKTNGGEAYSIICAQDGDLMVGRANPDYALAEDNLFASLSNTRLLEGESIEHIKANAQSGIADVFSYESGSNKRYVAYTPLQIVAADGERWVLINVRPGRTVDAAAGAITRLFTHRLLLVVAFASAAFALIILSQKRQARALAHERDQLHASEMQNRLAMTATGLELARYDLETGTYYNDSEILLGRGFPREIPNVPNTFIAAGLVAPESVDDYCAFYDKVRLGQACTATIALKGLDDHYHWFLMEPTFVYDADHNPYQAILSFRDVSDQLEKESAYERWRLSIQQNRPESYTMFRCNLSKSASFDKVEGALLKIYFSPTVNTFNGRTREYASRFVHLDDFDAYVDLLNSERLLASYYRGVQMLSMDYRERVSEGQYRWLRVKIEMVKYKASDDVEVYLMYTSIQNEKQMALAIQARINTDPLTGVLDRAAFIEQFGELLAKNPNGKHALYLLDIDDFRQLNDAFGHATGDQALMDIADQLRTVVRGNDLLGRLGGDEFLIALKDIPNQAVIEKKAMQIQGLLRKAYSMDVQISASMGIAVYPRDGVSFHELYLHVDKALHAAKENGRDSFSIFNGDAAQNALRPKAEKAPSGAKRAGKRRIMIVDDDPATAELLRQVFGEEYLFETAVDETTAVRGIRVYGLSISVILLSLDMPRTDGLALLDRLQNNEGLKSIPIIVLSHIDERELSLRALRKGASEFVLKPMDADLIRIRLESAIRKADNERIRAQNAYLQIQGGEGAKYRTVFENTGTMVVEYDWVNGRFTYDAIIPEHLYGKYDERPLWQIMLSDLVANAMDVKAMQELTHALAFDRKKKHVNMDVMLKTPKKTWHWFRMNAFKHMNAYDLTSKIIITFEDINEKVLSDEKLRFQAEHDALTGLYNRNAFIQAMEKATRDAKPGAYSILCGDIDNFSLINERYGREAGDQLLQYTSEKLAVYASSARGIVGRLGNDAFAMLLPNSPEMLDKASGVIREFFSDYPLRAKITCHVGAFHILDTGVSTDAMLDRAIIARDSIKGKYTQRLAVFDETMYKQALLEKDISDHMEEALAKGDFDVYIQPQFNHMTRKIVGAEALARWIDPEKGVVSPGTFIPVFEKNGFITKMDEYIWERTAQHYREWLDRGNDLVPISVNVSREDASDPRMPEKLMQIVRRYDIPIDMFRLEITESLFADDIEHLRSVVARLHEYGFMIEMDDFGAGYSSLNVLKDVPVDILKLDMRFFSGNDDMGRGGVIISSVLRMARWLNIAVIAEGVENREQADFLLSIGCDTIQGFLYEKPLPARDFEKLLEERGTDGRANAETPQTPPCSPLFWDPRSADSQLFNRYIGAAFVLERRNDQYEILRMNPECIQIFHLQSDIVKPLCVMQCICREDHPAFESAIRQAITTGEPSSVLIRLEADDCEAPVALRVTIRAVSINQEHALFLCFVEA